MEEEILGTVGDDILTGTAGDDRITPFSGDDIIDGGAGNDTVVFFGTHADYIITANADGSWTVTDTEQAADTQGTSIVMNIENFNFTRTGNFTPTQLFALQTTNDQTITGTEFSEDLSGSLGNDTLIAGAGADSLYGGPGDDRLQSGRGDDFVNGGIGTDILVLDGSLADFTIAANDDGSYQIADTRTGQNNQGTDQVINVEQVEFTSGETISMADWIGGGTQTTTLFNDVAGTTQFITGTQGQDAFVIDGASTDYGWGQTDDGTGIVVWSAADFDILTDIEEIRFTDGVVTQATDGTFSFTPNDDGGDTGNDDPGNDDPTTDNLIADVANENQFINGTAATDVFVIDGTSTDYGWGDTGDGTGIVVWQNQGPNFDILTDIEKVQFNNGTLERQTDGSYNFTATGTGDPGTGESGINTIADNATQNENINGTDRPDVVTFAGLSTEFGWGETQDSEGIVIWQGAAFDILNNIEQLSFTDGTITQLEDDTFVFASTSEIMALTGTAGQDTLTGGNANDTLNGAAGNDTLTGGSGLDSFIAVNNNGDDTITDFEDGYDLFDFSGHTTVNAVSDLTIVQEQANARISFDGGSFTVNDTQIDTLTFSDFIFI